MDRYAPTKGNHCLQEGLYALNNQRKSNIEYELIMMKSFLGHTCIIPIMGAPGINSAVLRTAFENLSNMISNALVSCRGVPCNLMILFEKETKKNVRGYSRITCVNVYKCFPYRTCENCAGYCSGMISSSVPVRVTIYLIVEPARPIR